MAIPDFLLGLQDTAMASAIRGDSGTGIQWFPIIETVHVLALATVYGTILMVDLRMLGFASRNMRLSKLAGDLLPYTWIAFAIAAVSGSMLFTTKAEIYWDNYQVRGKFLCMALAGVNMAIYQLGLHRRVSEWDGALPPPAGVRFAGAASLLLWTGVIVFGRWIGFTT